MRLLRELLRDLIAKHPPLARKLHQHTLWEIWETTVGPQIAAVARPARTQATTLVVAVATSAWMQELTYLKPELLSRIQAAVGPETITDLRFELGGDRR